MYRRDYERFEMNDEVIVNMANDVQESFILKNISARGAGLVGRQPLAENASFPVSLQIPFLSEKPINRSAKVIWCRQLNGKLWECGMDFGLDHKIEILPQ